jgi:SNF2 family DNA or RNA helicase
LKREADRLLDLKERTIDPIRKFISGKQREIYDEARRFIQENQANLSYLVAEDVDAVRSILADPECYRGQKLQQLKDRLETLKESLAAVIRKERSSAETRINELRNKLCGMADFAALKDEQKQMVEGAFADCGLALERHGLVPVIRDTVRSFEESKYSQLLSNMAHWSVQPCASSVSTNQSPAEKQAAESAKGSGSSPIEVISRNQVSIAFDQAWLATESDVERYIEAFKAGLLVEIRKGRRIQV